MSPLFKRSLTVLSLLALLGQGCTKGMDQATADAAKSVTLEMWGVVDDLDVYQPILNDYRKLHPNVTINYRRLRLEEYESELLNAMAEDRGPDLFMIHNDWTDKYLSKIVAMPATTKVASRIVTGTIKKESTYVLQSENSITLKTFKDQFADAVQKDVIRQINTSTDADTVTLQEKIMGLPVGMDTMALYYNKDLLNAAGIPNPAETWTDFQEQAKKLTKLNAQGEIIQSAAGIGTAFNVERAADLVTLLMMQNGAEMTKPESGDVTFHVIPQGLQDREIAPGLQALGFYTDFANPNKETYTWNDRQPNSLDAFLQGRAAYFFGYSYHLPDIRARAPRIHLGISKVPQIEGNPIKNFPNYWLWAVSKKTKSSDIAWNLLNFMIKPDESKKALDIAKRPAARKSQLSAQLEDEDVGVFASQVLTAASWYRGKDPQGMEDALLGMINEVVAGVSSLPDAANIAVQKISQTY